MVPWVPTYPSPKDKQVELTECEVQTYISNHRPVITLSGYPLAEPACFWIDTSHIYLRINWEKWCAVTPSSPSHALVLCDSRYCQVMMTVDNEIKEETAPVYHVAELPPDLFGPKAAEGKPDSEEELFEFKKRKAIAELVAAVPCDLDAIAYSHVRLGGDTIDMVVTSDHASILFAVFPKDEELLACPRLVDNGLGETIPDVISIEQLDVLMRQQKELLKIESDANLILAIIASAGTLDSMRRYWEKELAKSGVELVEYPKYERFLREHFLVLDDNDDSDDEE